MTRVQSGRLVCQECMTSLQCSSCKKRYELKYWGKHERKNHHSCLKTKLICKACRAQGFTAWSVEAYTCHTCSCKFGPNKFATFALQNVVGVQKHRLFDRDNCADISVQTSPRRHLRAASGRGRLFRGAGDIPDTRRANLQQNLGNKPRGSGGDEIYRFPGFEGHWSRFQRKAPICSKTCVINRVVPERRKSTEFQGSKAIGPDFSEKHQFATKLV